VRALDRVPSGHPPWVPPRVEAAELLRFDAPYEDARHGIQEADLAAADQADARCDPVPAPTHRDVEPLRLSERPGLSDEPSAELDQRVRAEDAPPREAPRDGEGLPSRVGENDVAEPSSAAGDLAHMRGDALEREPRCLEESLSRL